MISIFRNNCRRFWNRKEILFAILILTSGAIAAALFFSSREVTAANIAIVSDDMNKNYEYPGLNTTVLDEAPGLSEMASGKYDAVIRILPDGSFEIESIKSEEITSLIEALISGEDVDIAAATGRRGTGTTIIGFLLMFILMESTMLLGMFSDDKEHGQILRVAASPVSLSRYLLAQILFGFLFLLLPTMALLYIIKAIMGVSIGFHFFQFLLLLGLLCLLGTAFSLFLCAFLKDSDTVNMIGASAVILTSVLAGSFYSFDQGNELLGAVIRWFPQKNLLQLAEAMEQSTGSSISAFPLLYLTGIILLLFVLAAGKTRKDYIQKH